MGQKTISGAFILIILAVLTSCSVSKTNEMQYRNMTANELHLQLKNKDFFLIDVVNGMNEWDEKNYGLEDE